MNENYAQIYCIINYIKYLLYLLYYLKIQKIRCNNFTFECDEQYLQVLRLDIILDVEILLQRPVHELSEEDLSASVLVDLVKLRPHVLDWSHPLDKNRAWWALFHFKLPWFTFSIVSFIFGEVNSSLFTLWSIPVSNLTNNIMFTWVSRVIKCESFKGCTKSWVIFSL